MALWRVPAFHIVLAALGVVFALVAYSYASRYALTPPAGVSTYLCFMLLLAGILAPGFEGTRARISRCAQAKKTRAALIGLWCAPYLIYAAGTGDFHWSALLKLVTIAAAGPLIYKAFPVKDQQRFAIQDACLAAALILVVLTGQFKGIWNVPVNLDFMGRLFLTCVASWCWVFVRPVTALGYEFRFSGVVFRAAMLNFAYFALIAIPASAAVHFTEWNPRWHGVIPFCLDYLEIFLFIALLEELFFRGFLQNLLSRTLGSWVPGQALVSLLFGLFHILHRPFPNWRYVALASIAGWFYGSAYRQGGNLMASTLMHAAVDTVWRVWLTAGGN